MLHDAYVIRAGMEFKASSPRPEFLERERLQRLWLNKMRAQAGNQNQSFAVAQPHLQMDFAGGVRHLHCGTHGRVASIAKENARLVGASPRTANSDVERLAVRRPHSRMVSIRGAESWGAIERRCVRGAG